MVEKIRVECRQGLIHNPDLKNSTTLDRKVEMNAWQSYSNIWNIFCSYIYTKRNFKVYNLTQTYTHKVTLSNKVRKILLNVLGKLNGTKVK